VLTPVADLEPVRLGGALVASATLHSVGEIWRRDIRVGDIVEVERSGEVIPVIAAIHAERRAPSSEKYTPPTECPACAGPLVVESNGAVLRCPNPRCTQQLIRQLQHFISDEGVAMQGLGRDAIARMVRSGCVHTVADLYRLTPDRLELALPESTASTRARWVGAITGSKHADLWRFISGLGIPHVGISAAKALARRFPDLPSLAHAATSGDAFDGIGRETVASLAAYFSEAENRAMIAELAALGVKAASSTQPSDSRSLADSSHRRTYPDGKDQAAGLIPDRSRSAPFEGETGVERIVGRQGRIPAPRSAQFW
jgi:DNA ligase (NAD+)